MSIKVFFHVCVLDGARSFDVLDRLIDAIMLSGLYAEVSTINCCVTGSPSLVHIAVQRLRQSGNKYTVLRVSPADPLTAERLTLGLVPGSVEDDDRVLYVHTKGVTRHNDSRVDDWTRMLTYFCVGRYRDCLAMLESNDVVGANYQTVPKPHFSGNFWWARGDFLRRLDPDAMSRTAKRGSQDWHVSPEMDFLFQDLSGHRPRVLSMHDSGVDHYRANYPRSEYVDAPDTNIFSSTVI